MQMTEIRLIWRREAGWTIITSPDKPNFLVASPDEKIAFSDIPIVWHGLLELERESTGDPK